MATVDSSTAVERHARAVARLAEVQTQAATAAKGAEDVQRQLTALSARERAAAAKVAKARELAERCAAHVEHARAGALIDAGTPDEAAAAAKIAEAESLHETARQQLAAAEAEAAQVAATATPERERLQAAHAEHLSTHAQASSLAGKLQIHAVEAQTAAGSEVLAAMLGEYDQARQNVESATRALDEAYAAIQTLTDSIPERLAAYPAAQQEAAQQLDGPRLRAVETIERARAYFLCLQRHGSRMAPAVNTVPTFMCLEPDPAHYSATMRHLAMDVPHDHARRRNIMLYVLAKIEQALYRK